MVVMLVDLHCHSTFSDGALTPQQLLQRAKDAKVNLFALTDHDTIFGLHDFSELELPKDLNIVSGVEISARWRKYDLHILGYNFDASNKRLLSLLAQQKDNRLQRAHSIAEILAEHGVADAYSKASDCAGSDNIGRPHFAKVLISERKVVNIQQAFDKYLGRGKLAYVKSAWADLSDVVETIVAAGGSAVIAHPLKYKLTITKLVELINDFKSSGGQGLEVISSGITSSDILYLTEICKDYDLLSSTGSDYHADGISRIGIGMQKQLPKLCRPIWQTWSGLNERNICNSSR